MSDGSASEWLDIVDGEDQVTGRDTRARVHEAGHFHRSAHVVLFNTDGQVFIQLRSLSKDTGAGLWDASAAGHVESGESYVDCAVRELHEELGIEIKASALEWVAKLQPQERNGMEFTHVFTVICDQSLTLQEEEIDDGCWLSPEELSMWMASDEDEFTEVFKIIWPMVGRWW